MILRPLGDTPRKDGPVILFSEGGDGLISFSAPGTRFAAIIPALITGLVPRHFPKIGYFDRFSFFAPRVKIGQNSRFWPKIRKYPIRQTS